MEIAITPTNAERLKEMQSIWERFNELYYDIKMDSQFYDLLDAENRRLTMENSLMQRELEKHGIRFENLETKETRINLKPLNAVQQNFLKKILV